MQKHINEHKSVLIGKSSKALDIIKIIHNIKGSHSPLTFPEKILKIRRWQLYVCAIPMAGIIVFHMILCSHLLAFSPNGHL